MKLPRRSSRRRSLITQGTGGNPLVVITQPIKQEVGERRLLNPIEIKCARCGTRALGQRNKRYCRVECARLAWASAPRKKAPKKRGSVSGNCLNCGAPFVGQRNKRFCSRACSFVAYRHARPEVTRRATAAYRARHPERIAQQNKAAYPRRKSYHETWKQEHAEQVRQYWRRHQAKYPERRKEAQRRSYVKHAEKRRAETARWRKENLDKRAFSSAARRARVMAAPGTHTYQEWLDLIERFGGRCAYCGARTKRLTRDHIVPLKMGGGNAIANILPACPPCNARKGLTPIELFRARLTRDQRQ